MEKFGLVSNYTVKQYKVYKSKCNEEKAENIVNREFDRKESMEVVVSDLTYVNVKGKWNYICILLGLYNHEIIGYAAGKIKIQTLFTRPLQKLKVLWKTSIFYILIGEMNSKII